MSPPRKIVTHFRRFPFPDSAVTDGIRHDNVNNLLLIFFARSCSKVVVSAREADANIFSVFWAATAENVAGRKKSRERLAPRFDFGFWKLGWPCNRQRPRTLPNVAVRACDAPLRTFRRLLKNAITARRVGYHAAGRKSRRLRVSASSSSSRCRSPFFQRTLADITTGSIGSRVGPP